MCGIAGFTHIDGTFPPEKIHQAVASIIHRGPDHQGVYQDPIVSLGATRLQVIDVEAGFQNVLDVHRSYAGSEKVEN